MIRFDVEICFVIWLGLEFVIYNGIVRDLVFVFRVSGILVLVFGGVGIYFVFK